MLHLPTKTYYGPCAECERLLVSGLARFQVNDTFYCGYCYSFRFCFDCGKDTKDKIAIKYRNRIRCEECHAAHMIRVRNSERLEKDREWWRNFHADRRTAYAE